MARVKLSEFRAKSLLIDNYSGADISLESLNKDISRLSPDSSYIIKVDQGIKKRGKQGLIRLNISKNDAKKAVEELAEKGFSRFIAEPMFPHKNSEEQYISFERTRDGIVIHHSQKGGIDVEDSSESIKVYSPDNAPIAKEFVQRIIDTMDTQHLSFVEINPLVIRGEEYILLDAAVLVDSAGEHIASWSETDIVEAHTPTKSEAAIAELNQNSPAAFSFRVLNPDGALWLLLSGGGASITIADEAMNQGRAGLIANYGEYSGGPTQEETYLYTQKVLSQLFTSKAPKKALIIAGGVANFTDVKKTFGGVIQALDEVLDDLAKHKVKVFVRRGGPNEAEGLKKMEVFLKEHDLFGSVHGSDIVLTDAINEALEYIDA